MKIDIHIMKGKYIQKEGYILSVNKSVVILLVLCAVLFAGCQSASIPSLESEFSASTVSQTGEEDTSTGTTENVEASIPTDSDTVSGSSETVKSNPPAQNTSADSSEQLPAPTQTPVPQPTETEKPPVPSHTETRNPDPPKTSEPEPPPHTVPTEVPSASEPKISPEETLTPGKQYCDPENDPYGVVVIIRAYAEAEERGFVLNESLTIENSGYRGHPNVTDWTLDGVVDTLKYHVDKLLEIQGPSYYNVVYRVYQGKLEYYFLVR